MSTTHDTLPARDVARPRGEAPAGLTGTEFRAWTDGLLNRHPAVGLAVGVVRHGRLALFEGRGLADPESGAPVDVDTVFRIGSVTKPVTAVAVMQLHEQGRIDLDAPADEYLRAFGLVPAHAGVGQPTVRHLLTHTAGIPDVQHLRDLIRPGAGPFASRPPVPSVTAGEPVPSPARHYRRGVRVVLEPGATFAYSNPGYAVLGQVVEDVSGLSLGRYLIERIFDPLGMASCDLTRSYRNVLRLATGHTIGRRGVRAVPERDWLGAGSGGAYSSTADMARFAAALTGGGRNAHGSVLTAATVSTMFAPHHRPDRRLPGWGLGFARADAGGHRLVGHDGILPGFNSALLVAPDDDLAVVAFTNGSPGAFTWLGTELRDLLRRLLGVPADEVRTDVPHHPEVWAGLCGVYRLPARISDLRGRLALPGGVEVLVRAGRLTVRALTPVPALFRGVPLHPDDADDPYAFRLDLSDFGTDPVRVVFADPVAGRSPALHTDLGGQPLSLVRRANRQRTRRGPGLR